MLLVEAAGISFELIKEVFLGRHIWPNNFKLRGWILLLLLFSPCLLDRLRLDLVHREENLLLGWCWRLLLLNLSNKNWTFRRKHILLCLSLRRCCHAALLFLSWLWIWLSKCFWQTTAYTFRNIHSHPIVNFSWLHLVDAIIRLRCNRWSRTRSFDTSWNSFADRRDLGLRSLGLLLAFALLIICGGSSHILDIKLFNIDLRCVAIVCPSASLLTVKLLYPTVKVVFVIVIKLVIVKILALVKVLQFHLLFPWALNRISSSLLMLRLVALRLLNLFNIIYSDRHGDISAQRWPCWSFMRYNFLSSFLVNLDHPCILLISCKHHLSALFLFLRRRLACIFLEFFHSVGVPQRV